MPRTKQAPSRYLHTTLFIILCGLFITGGSETELRGRVSRPHQELLGIDTLRQHKLPEELSQNMPKQAEQENRAPSQKRKTRKTNWNLHDFFSRPEQIMKSAPTQNSGEKWTFIVYIAGDNNLHRYVMHNISQMTRIGSNNNINIAVQIDQYGKKMVQRAHIEKDKIVIVDEFEKKAETVSGSPESLFECAKWAINTYPSDRVALIFWNHGSGTLDPHRWSRSTSRRRSEGNYRNAFGKEKRDLGGQRGILFNDGEHAGYLNNQDLSQTLKRIVTELRNGKKIDLIGMDACNMAMLEIGAQVKEWADFLVGSQEFELGPGWDYEEMLSQFKTTSPSPEQFATHLVVAYEKSWLPYTHDFTQSAIRLSGLDEIEKNINSVGQLLATTLEGGHGKNLLKAIQNIRRNSRKTTWFYGNNYVDLRHFYLSLLSCLKKEFSSSLDSRTYNQLILLLASGVQMINKTVINNRTGAYLPDASGLSIYFPNRSLHSSYPLTQFGKDSAWLMFIKTYLKKRH